MKRISLIFVCLSIVATMYAEEPSCTRGCFNYQAVIRGPEGNVLPLLSVELRITLRTSENGEVRWQETHNVVTDNYGTFGIKVGAGGDTTGAPTFDHVNFEAVHLWMQVEFREIGKTLWEPLSNERMPTVPYARVAFNTEGNEAFDREFGIIYEELDNIQALVNNQLDDAAAQMAALNEQMAAMSASYNQQLATMNQQIATLNSQITNLQNKVVPPGTIIAFGGPSSAIPEGWLPCDGTTRSSSTYPELFNVIGSSWGPFAGGQFTLPDLRGMFLRGVDTRTSGSDDPDGNSRTSRNGSLSGRNVGSYQGDKIRNIKGVFKTKGIEYNHTVVEGCFSYNTYNLGSSTHASGALNNAAISISANDGITSQNPMAGFADGGDIRPKNVYVNYIIKY